MDIASLLYNNSNSNCRFEDDDASAIPQWINPLPPLQKMATNGTSSLPIELRPSRSYETRATTPELLIPPPPIALLDDKLLKRRSETMPPTYYSGGKSAAAAVDNERHQDRRQRNKMASAKYRAKRNQETANMRRTVEMLKRQNNMLQQQLNEAYSDRSRMSAQLDRLQYIVTRGMIGDDSSDGSGGGDMEPSSVSAAHGNKQKYPGFNSNYA
ncbi:hypothetical protein BDB00DRAFT_859900 [Zychaea mexicana]|uniref:uncharacterized protein n=1 Tax=Zychaea mexicana TaxID=64656 RepID=UPI0022FED1A3|nr:uncharacterized protein BDB00DRAFT_859900 [Zychaea mexicana]KAI9476632.1 hypothetical protein BDB00DRAFT_859900 [Zychaea mexicana]